MVPGRCSLGCWLKSGRRSLVAIPEAIWSGHSAPLLPSKRKNTYRNREIKRKQKFKWLQTLLWIVFFANGWNEMMPLNIYHQKVHFQARSYGTILFMFTAKCVRASRKSQALPLVVNCWRSLMTSIPKPRAFRAKEILLWPRLQVTLESIHLIRFYISFRTGRYFFTYVAFITVTSEESVTKFYESLMKGEEATQRADG